MLKYALIFSGQGSERANMFNDFVSGSTLSSEIGDLARERLPIEIEELILSRDNLAITVENQTRLLLFHYLMAHYVTAKIGYEPELCMGHSFGQFSALVQSGAVSIADMIRFVCERTKIVNSPEIAVSARLKSAHGLSLDEFKDFYKQEHWANKVELALHNQREQIVVAATPAGEVLLEELLRKRGGILKNLSVSMPYHTTFMTEHNNRLLPSIDRLMFSDPSCFVLMNNSRKLVSDKESLRRETRVQMIEPVFWYESVLVASELIDAFIIIDPGKTQFMIVKRISAKKIHNVSNVGAARIIEKRGL